MHSARRESCLLQHHPTTSARLFSHVRAPPKTRQWARAGRRLGGPSWAGRRGL